MSTLKERLADVMTRKGVRQIDLINATGASQPSVANWMNGRTTTIKMPYLRRAAEFLGVDEMWLADGSGSPIRGGEIVRALGEGETAGDAYVAVPEYAVRFSAGAGCSATFEEVVDSRPMIYLRSWFQKRGINPKNCRRFSVHGESMEPLLFEGDKILVDCTPDQPVKSGHVYAIAVDGEDRVKRLVPLISGDMLVQSDNENYPTEKLTREEWDARVQVIGRVIDRSGSGGL